MMVVVIMTICAQRADNQGAASVFRTEMKRRTRINRRRHVTGGDNAAAENIAKQSEYAERAPP